MTDFENDLEDEVPVTLWGLPADIANELAPAWHINWARWFGGWAAWLIMIGGFVVGWLEIWPYLDGLNTQTAQAQAIDMNALMYETNFGFAMLVWLFAWIITSASVAGFLILTLPMPLKGALFIGLMGDSGAEPFNKQALQGAKREVGETGSASDLLNAWAVRYIGSALKYALPLGALGAFILTREIASFSVYSVEGYYRAPLFPWAEETLTEWSTAERVELGCNQTSDGGSVVYKIFFKNGKSARIEDGVLIGDTKWLDALETIDKELVKGDASFERWQWLKRDPLHPKCLRGFYGMLGKEQGDRLLRLLRVGDFDGDVEIG